MLALASVLRHSQCWAHLARGRDGMYIQTKYRTQKTRFACMVLGQKQLSPGQGSSTIVVVPQQMSKTLTWKHTAVSPTPRMAVKSAYVSEAFFSWSRTGLPHFLWTNRPLGSMVAMRQSICLRLRRVARRPAPWRRARRQIAPPARQSGSPWTKSDLAQSRWARPTLPFL